MKYSYSSAQIIVLVTVVALFFVVVHSLIIPVILGLLISLILRPVWRKINGVLKGRRRLSAILTTLLLLLGVLLPAFLVGTAVSDDVRTILNALKSTGQPSDLKNGEFLKIPFMSEIYDKVVKIYPISPEEFTERMKSLAATISAGGGKFLANLLASIPGLVLGLVLFLISFYFGLVDGSRLVNFLRPNIPFSGRETEVLFRTTRKICNAVVLGAFTAGLIQATILGLAFWIFDIPGALLFAFLTVICSFIPMVGSAPAGIAGTLYLLVTGRLTSAIGMLVIFGIAAVSDNIVKPLVLKGKVQLHPLLGLLSVLGGLKIFGLAGLFLGPVITGLMIAIFRLRERKGHPKGDEKPHPTPKESGKDDSLSGPSNGIAIFK